MRHVDSRLTSMIGTILPLLVTCILWWAPTNASAAGGESAFVGLLPCRLVDTRGNGFGDAFGPPSLETGTPRDFPLQGQCGIPATAVALSLNVTATNTQGPGFLMLYPQGAAQPLVSTLNYVAGETVANAALVPLGAGGLTVVAGVSGTDLILDVDGYFTDGLVHAVDPDNLFVGPGAGNLAVVGVENTAVGARALSANTTGYGNTAVGGFALTENTEGFINTAIGRHALASNTEGGANVAIGQSALLASVTGHQNIAIGFFAGGMLVDGSRNIYIGDSSGGGSTETATVRIGTTQTRTFIAGIRGKTTGVANTVPVLIDGEGQLGTINSSRRVKTDIEPVGERSRGLHALRPVSFRYRVHPPDGPVEYGLIAEEVAEVYPELVVRDAEGAPETVRYQLLPALLLNELQAARAQITELAARVAELAAEVGRLKGRGPVAVERNGE